MATTNMTPAQRNAETLKNLSASLAGPKKTTKPSTKGKAPAKSKSKGVVDKANDFIDWAFRDSVNKKVASASKAVSKKISNPLNQAIASINKKVDEAGRAAINKKVASANKVIDKTIRKPINTKVASIAKKVDKKISEPIRTAIYGKPKPAAKAPAKKAPAKKVTAPKKTVTTPSSNASIEQKAKDVMSGKYGNGAARREALGADYDKVQAIINKNASVSKAKVTPKAVPAEIVIPQAAPERMEIRKPELIPYTGPKELVGKTSNAYQGSGMGAMERAEKEFETNNFKKGGIVKSKTKQIMATKKRKYQDGGAPASFKDQKKAIKQSNKLAALTAKGERIKAGTEPTLYDKAAKITGNIADTAASASTIVKAVKDKSGGSGDASGRPGFQKGGGIKTTKGRPKYIDSKIKMRGPDRPMPKPMMAQKGGAMSTVKAGVKQVAKGVKKGVTDSVKSAKTTAKAALKSTPEYRLYKAAGKTAKSIDDTIQKRYPNYTGKGSMYAGAKQGVKTLLGYQKGGVPSGRNISQKAAERKTSKGKGYISSIMGANPSGNKGEYVPFTRAGRKDAKTKGMVSSKEMKPSRQIMKTGGMVNPNAAVKRQSVAGSKGVKSGVNPRAAASRVARGRVGGTSAAPKTATPKAQYGMTIKKK
jgi:hypothetical protein